MIFSHLNNINDCFKREDLPNKTEPVPPKYIDLYFQGKLMLDEMITNRYRLDGVNDAFEALRGGKVMRSILAFD